MWDWRFIRIADILSSRSSSISPSTPARKNTLVCPTLHLSASSPMCSKQAVAIFLSSFWAFIWADAKIWYLYSNSFELPRIRYIIIRSSMKSKSYRKQKSVYIILLGKPLRQIRIPSSTPLQVSWCITREESMSPGVFTSLGMMQRIKWGWVAFSVDIKLFNCSR